MRKLIFVIASVIILSSCDYYLVNPHQHQVGEPQKPFGGDKDFQICYEEKILPHYYGFRRHNGYIFKPGKDSLRSHFRENYNNQGIINESGYITLRFIINCKGETGRFILEELGFDYKKKKFNPELTEHLLTLTKSLKDWTAFSTGDVTFDSFTHLTFKIENGELLEILP